MTRRKTYEAPTMTTVEAGSDRWSRLNALRKFRFRLNADGTFQALSSEFSELVGFAEGALLGLPITCVTAPQTVHIAQLLATVTQFGCFHCPWLFVRADGHPVLVRTDWILLSDKSMDVDCEPLPVFE
jgi:hypothetical protein